MPHFRPEMKIIPAKRTAIAALFTAVSAVSGQMSGDLNGSAARFAAQILLGLKILQKSGYAVTISVFLI